MSKLAKAGNQNIAKDALEREVDATQIGAFIEAIHDEAFVTSYLFESQLKGYQGWRWSVTLTQVDARHAATVSEVLLIGGPGSIVAPKWVPWSERLADYRALQAALEEQAKLDAAEADGQQDDAAADGSPEKASATEEGDSSTPDQPAKGRRKKSASTKVDQHEQAEQQADDAAAEPPKRLRWLTRKKRH